MTTLVVSFQPDSGMTEVVTTIFSHLRGVGVGSLVTKSGQDARAPSGNHAHPRGLEPSSPPPAEWVGGEGLARHNVSIYLQLSIKP